MNNQLVPGCNPAQSAFLKKLKDTGMWYSDVYEIARTFRRYNQR